MKATGKACREQAFQLPPLYLELRDLLEKSYVFVDLAMDEHERAIFDQMKIERGGNYNRYGNIELLSEELPHFLKEMGNTETDLVKDATQAIERIVALVIAASGKETAWITLRAAPETSSFDIPRWHMDGYYYQPYFLPQCKFATALKGNPTLFYPLTPASRALYLEFHEEIAKLAEDTDVDTIWQIHQKNREKLSQMFPPEHAESAPEGHGAFFMVGHNAVAALHSEPKFDKPRLFISIVPGSKSEIKSLQKKAQ